MNFLKQAFTSYTSHSSRSSRQTLFLLRPITRSSLYSTTYRLSNPPTRKPRTTQKSQEPSAPPPSPPWSSSSLTWGQRIKKQAEGLTDWPRPIEIPYQSKIANLVNLIGHVTTPVKFYTGPDGKSFASAVISQEKSQPLVIPMVFEGDLASVVAIHVRKNDCVYVVGKLSEDPLPFDLMDECRGNFHLVVENINFVEGYENKPSSRPKNVSTESASGGRTYPRKFTEQDHDDRFSPSKTLENESSEPKFSQDSLNNSKAEENDDVGNDPWKDLVKNPSRWRDYREQKSNGTVVPKHPDFKNGRISLWLNAAPKWVLPEIENQFGKFNEKKEKETKGEESWKNLVENPSKWWDNRLRKKNPKGPDFTHKETKEALWLNTAPSWFRQSCLN